MTIDKKTLRTLSFGVIGCIVIYWVLNEWERVVVLLNGGYQILSPFILGAAVAFVLNVPMRAIERGMQFVKKPGLRRGLAILLTMLAMVLVLAGVFYLLVPQVVETVESLIVKLPDFFERLKQWAISFLEEHPELMQMLNEYTDFENINWGEWIERIVAMLTGGLGVLIDGAFLAVINLSNGIFDAILSLVFALYCLSRKEILARQGRRILYSFIPEHAADTTVRIFRMTNATFSNFISGQCLEALILGLMFAVAMSIFRMPFMPLVSVIIAVTALVPIVGAFVGCVLGAFFILVQDPALAFWFVVMFLVLQQIEGNMIYPRVVGSSIGLPGMWVLVAVAVGGDLMGVGGMLVMIPVVSVLYTLAREITTRRLEDRAIPADKLQDHPPEITSKFKEKRKKKKEQRLLKKLEKMKEKIAHHEPKEEE